MRGTRCIALATAAAVLPTAALAAPAAAPSVVVQPLEVDGDVAPAWHAEFDERLRVGLGRRSAHLVTPDASACNADDRACWQALAVENGAPLIVRPLVTKSERDYEIKLDVISAESGAVVATAKQPCELCGLAEVGGLLEDVAGTIAARVDSLASATTVVLFQSVPAGAQLRLDGEPIGQMPLSHEVGSGDHQAEAVLAEHVQQTRSFVAEPGVDQTVRFELAALPRERKALPAIGWASLGVGLATVAAGAVVIAVDEKPITSNCSGENVNAAGVCKFRRDTLAGGITLVAAGAAAVIAGVAIVVVAKRKRSRRVAASIRALAIRF